MYDYELTKQIAERVVLEIRSGRLQHAAAVDHRAAHDGSARATSSCNGPATASGDNQPFQYLDREYMKADEYDDFLFDPTGYYLHTYLPRVASAFEGFAELPVLPGLHYFRLVAGIRGFAQPQVREAFERVMNAAEEADRFSRTTWRFTDHMAQLGYP